ncbi:DUF4860 domain-containing protein [Pseudobutyrivibrio sp.]|uniref:DUF4860 domain-containing protein n=1 Tax=Pseudobutyrivibrio sp. TaxID=2014367 RepID=UPI001D27E076|nr:DUF4860 domain-containing protein [Pseudobutyrivibrio sp.]MBE5910840.1 DUF4860 domain-containing protein [Pseudobutyrivibrio sp.]
MSIGRSRKHNIDIMFLMILFLIFTFSAVSVLLMAVNSYRSVVNANESNANARTAIAYIREVVRQHDSAGVIDISTIDGCDCIRMSEGTDYYLYIYEYDGYLMELEAKENSGVTADFGSKILEINSLDISLEKDSNTMQIEIENADGQKENVSIGIKSGINNGTNASVEEDTDEE